jgi:molecular chaperone DnaK
MQASMKIGEAVYAAQQGGEGGDDDGAAGPGTSAKDDVIDADFREVNDDDGKKKSA